MISVNLMELKLILVGKGNVGNSFLNILNEKGHLIENQFGIQLKLISILEYDGALISEDGLIIDEILKLGNNFRELPYREDNTSFQDIISKYQSNIMIETTPTNATTGEPGLTHITSALKSGIHVISSNKGPFYLDYQNLKKLAEENSVSLRYEATVASAIPVLSIKNNLEGNQITSIQAILNGTSNYILSRMSSEGISLQIALKEAQELGYAEANPELDISGYDAAGKLVILANTLMDWSKNIHDVKIQGIEGISPNAIELAKSEGYVIKPLAVAENGMLVVEPRLIKKDSPLDIDGTLNVIKLETDYAGPIILMGKGAGGFEAASAIMNDLLFIIRKII